MGPLLGTAVNSLFWFFTYRFTLAPILLIFPIFVVLGLVIPLLTYRSIARHTVWSACGRRNDKRAQDIKREPTCLTSRLSFWPMIRMHPLRPCGARA